MQSARTKEVCASTHLNLSILKFLGFRNRHSRTLLRRYQWVVAKVVQFSLSVAAQTLKWCVSSQAFDRALPQYRPWWRCSSWWHRRRCTRNWIPFGMYKNWPIVGKVFWQARVLNGADQEYVQRQQASAHSTSSTKCFRHVALTSKAKENCREWLRKCCMGAVTKATEAGWKSCNN